LRLLAQLSHQHSQGMSLETLFTQFKVWEKRKPLLTKALRRHSTVSWRRLLLLAGRIDRLIKGAAVGNAWEELSWLCIGMTTDYPLPDFFVGE
jgi:DNA polymerase III subunit delta